MKILCIRCGKQTEKGGYTARIKGHILRPVCKDCQHLCSTYPDQVLWENPALFDTSLSEQQSVDSPRLISNEVLEWRNRLRKMLLENGVTQPPRRVLAGRGFLLLGVTLWAFTALFMSYNAYRKFTSKEAHSNYRMPVEQMRARGLSEHAIAVGLQMEMLADDIRKYERAKRELIFDTVGFMAFVGLPIYLYFRNKGRRTLAPDAFAELDRLPDRRPVLFLRPFSREPMNRVVYKVFGVGEWFELAVVKELRKNWPVIAIGKPGERLPPMGAGRFYVPEVHWQETVLWFLSECQLVMLVYGATPGVLSELRMIVGQGDPSKLVLCIPGDSNSSRKKHAAWRAFREKTLNIFPKPLPESPGGSLFMRFDASWNPVLVAPPSRVSLLRSRAVRTALRAAIARDAEAL